MLVFNLQILEKDVRRKLKNLYEDYRHYLNTSEGDDE